LNEFVTDGILKRVYTPGKDITVADAGCCNEKSPDKSSGRQDTDAGSEDCAAVAHHDAMQCHDTDCHFQDLPSKQKTFLPCAGRSLK